MEIRIITFLLLILVNVVSCQTQDENGVLDATEVIDESSEKPNIDIGQLVEVHDGEDLAQLPKLDNYIKEQSFKGANSSPYGYVIRKPVSFGQDDKKYPVLIYLHGVGSRGNSNNNPTDLSKVDKDGAIRAIKLGIWSPKVAMPVIAPQTNTNWKPSDVKKFIGYVIETYKTSVNVDRIYLAGFSMGGFGVWSYLDHYGYDDSMVAAAVSMAGVGENSGENVEELKYMPFWVFHGKKDPTVPYSRSLEVVSKFRGVYNLQEHQKLTFFTQDDFEGQYHRIDHGVFDSSLWNKNTSGDIFNVDVMNWLLQYKRVN
jgi:predicted peptidase